MNIAFEGDTFIKDELIKLRDKFVLTRCVETGTQYGSTTLELYDVFKNVITIEADERYYNIAGLTFFEAKIKKGILIESIFGKSEILLYSTVDDNTLFYLDAHGCDIGGSPLKKELEVIASKNLKNICIAIHDFKVPEHPEFGYDAYDYELCFEEIEPFLKMIYSDGFSYHYNDQADGAMRGVIFIYPFIK